MGKKKHGAFNPYNEYVLDLGAHIPPAPPEKEHAKMHGFKLGLFIATAIACLFLIFYPELDVLFDKLFVSGETQTSVSLTELSENQSKVFVKAWLDDTLLENECPKHDDCGDMIHFVSTGDELYIQAYSMEGQVEQMEYCFPSVSMEFSSIDGDEGNIVLPQCQEGAVTLLWIQVTDTKGNMVLEEYNLYYQ
ncbi:MAG: hypothetical protein IJB59_14535 [Oscillospiraceae bacterium]|nr:hypothetical protein [Oscillospiraceae bacterium]